MPTVKLPIRRRKPGTKTIKRITVMVIIALPPFPSRIASPRHETTDGRTYITFDFHAITERPVLRVVFIKSLRITLVLNKAILFGRRSNIADTCRRLYTGAPRTTAQHCLYNGNSYLTKRVHCTRGCRSRPWHCLCHAHDRWKNCVIKWITQPVLIRFRRCGHNRVKRRR